jgi:hypothetical protein
MKLIEEIINLEDLVSIMAVVQEAMSVIMGLPKLKANSSSRDETQSSLR